MDIIHWRPAREAAGPWRRLREIEEEMDSLLGRFMGRHQASQGDAAWAPAVDIKESGSEIIVKADLPEVKAEDVDITVESGVLSIRGERKAQDGKKTEGYSYSERRWGAFARSITLPVEVDEAGAKASYRDGVLTVAMPKRKEEKAKHIKVNVE